MIRKVLPAFGLTALFLALTHLPFDTLYVCPVLIALVCYVAQGETGLNKVSDDGWLWVGMGACLFAVQLVATMWLYVRGYAPYERELSRQFLTPKVIISIAVLGPIFEELLIRGYLLGTLLREMKTWAAIAISAFVFAVAHWNRPAHIMFLLFLTGLWLGTLRWKTNSILPGLFFHMAYNASLFWLM